MKTLLASEITDENLRELTAKMGVGASEMDYTAAITVAMIREAALGNVKAYRAICDVVGISNDSARLKLQQDEAKRKHSEENDGGRLAELIEGLRHEREDDLHE